MTKIKIRSSLKLNAPVTKSMGQKGLAYRIFALLKAAFGENLL